MKYIALGRKIKELRLQSGISQYELAEISQLSLRTIQRIENGETAPRGDSVKRISKALNINVEALTVETPTISEPLLKENKWVLFLINFSALGFLIYPFLGVIFPMILWIIFKDEIMLANKTGKKVIKSQVIWCILLFIVYFYVFILQLSNLNLPLPKNETVILLFIISLYIFNVLDILFGLLKFFEIKKTINKVIITFKHLFIKGNIATIFFISSMSFLLVLC